MDFFRQHILTIVAFWPLAGMIVLLFFNKENKTLIRLWANLVLLIGFIVSLPLWFWFDRDTSDQMQFVENFQWIQTLGAHYHVGIDGISLLLVMLTTLLGPLAVLSSWEAIQSRMKEYYVFMLMLQAGMLGVFISLDFFLFYVFWEVMLVPMYFLIGVWGGPRKLYAAIKFFLYTLVGSVLLLLGILALYFIYPQVAAQHPEIVAQFGAGPTFDILAFHAIAPYLTFDFQYWIFLAFFVGFAIKVPMFPFHTWLPDAHVEAPTAGSVILAGVLLKMGTYGFLRFSLPILPEGTRVFHPDDDRALDYRHRLRRPRRHDAAGHEEAGGVFIGQSYGIRHARHVRAESERLERQHHPADQSWDFDRRAVLDRRHDLRAAAHA